MSVSVKASAEYVFAALVHTANRKPELILQIQICRKSYGFSCKAMAFTNHIGQQTELVGILDQIHPILRR